MTTGQITPSTALVTMELFACGYRGDDSHAPQLPSPERDALAELSNIAMARAANKPAPDGRVPCDFVGSQCRYRIRRFDINVIDSLIASLRERVAGRV
jgi:hypothetical protein